MWWVPLAAQAVKSYTQQSNQRRQQTRQRVLAELQEEFAADKTKLLNEDIDFANNNLHLNEWIAKNDDEYISKAIKFSENKKYLTNLKKELRNNALAGPLFDSESFSENFYEMLLNICNK